MISQSLEALSGFIKPFSYKNFYEKSSSIKALFSVSVEPSESRKSIENICEEENSRIYVASSTLKGTLSSQSLARSTYG